MSSYVNGDERVHIVTVRLSNAERARLLKLSLHFGVSYSDILRMGLLALEKANRADLGRVA